MHVDQLLLKELVFVLFVTDTYNDVFPTLLKMVASEHLVGKMVCFWGIFFKNEVLQWLLYVQLQVYKFSTLKCGWKSYSFWAVKYISKAGEDHEKHSPNCFCNYTHKLTVVSRINKGPVQMWSTLSYLLPIEMKFW